MRYFTSLGKWRHHRQVLPILIILCFAMSFSLSVTYTVWAVHQTMQQTCKLIHDEMMNRHQNPQIRHDFTVLYQERGCGH